MPDPISKRSDDAIPDQLMEIAHEQEGGAERVINQIEVVERSFEEIQQLTKECQEILPRLMPPSEERDELIGKLESISVHADNGQYNVRGVFDLFQYQDIVRQKLEKVGHRLIDVSEYILKNLAASKPEIAASMPSGRDIMDRHSDAPDEKKEESDVIVAEFFAKLRAQKASQKQS
jgi:hypothetical protein